MAVCVEAVSDSDRGCGRAMIVRFTRTAQPAEYAIAGIMATESAARFEEGRISIVCAVSIGKPRN